MQPSDRGQHCPFLNRTDSRCGTHFTLERLEHAFAYCFDRYTACPVYLELLVERRVRRGEARRLGLVREEAQEKNSEELTPGVNHEDRPLVEITIRSRRFAQIAARIGGAASKRAA